MVVGLRCRLLETRRISDGIMLRVIEELLEDVVVMSVGDRVAGLWFRLTKGG